MHVRPIESVYKPYNTSSVNAILLRSIPQGLSVMLELQGVLRERQSQLEDAVFQLKAMRQVARLLSSVHSAEETENLVLDFVAVASTLANSVLVSEAAITLIVAGVVVLAAKELGVPAARLWA